MPRAGQVLAPRPIPTEGHRLLSNLLKTMSRSDLARELDVSFQATTYVVVQGNVPSKHQMAKFITLGIPANAWFEAPKKTKKPLLGDDEL